MSRKYCESERQATQSNVMLRLQGHYGRMTWHRVPRCCDHASVVVTAHTLAGLDGLVGLFAS
jgi:hypothetical protein